MFITVKMLLAGGNQFCIPEYCNIMAKVFPSDQVIVVGGGLAGFSAAHTVIEHGGKVLLLDKSAFCGGNSTKATSGINGSGTKSQKALSIADSAASFTEDVLRGGSKSPQLAKTMCEESASGVDWLVDKFGLDLSLVSRLGGHSQPRTHRGKERFPGMTITFALMERFEKLCDMKDGRARLINRANVTKLITGESAQEVIGCQWTDKDGKDHKSYGPVILATGGFGADFTANSLLAKHRPDLLHLPTTNGEHCTGDGIKMGEAIGANTVDLEWVQVHPTGLVNPDDPDAKVKFLAAEALRGVGGLLLDAHGNRFANELGRRDYVTGEMWNHQPPFRLVLNSKASKEIEWHCAHYCGRGVMRKFNNGAELAKEMKVPVEKIAETFNAHNELAEKSVKDPEGGPYNAYPTGKSWDKFGKKFFHNTPNTMDETLHVAIVTPVIHYCMGGLEITPAAEVKHTKGGLVTGLFAAGEIMGGVHGNNRLGGNSLLDCVVYGRISGRTAAAHAFGRDSRFRPAPKEDGVYTPGCA